MKKGCCRGGLEGHDPLCKFAQESVGQKLSREVSERKAQTRAANPLNLSVGERVIDLEPDELYGTSGIVGEIESIGELQSDGNVYADIWWESPKGRFMNGRPLTKLARVETMTNLEYLQLGAKFALRLLYRNRTIDSGSADGCNLWALFQEGLGNHDPNPQVPLADIVARVRGQIGDVPPSPIQEATEWLEKNPLALEPYAGLQIAVHGKYGVVAAAKDLPGLQARVAELSLARDTLLFSSCPEVDSVGVRLVP